MTIRSKIGSKDKTLTVHKQVNRMFDKTRSKKLIAQQLDLLLKVDFDAIKISGLIISFIILENILLTSLSMFKDSISVI